MSNEMLDNAIFIATTAHRGQFDKAGKPYILHPLRVMHTVDSEDLEVLAMAVLHDVIEDSKWTYTDFREYGLSERIIEGVKALTKVKGETYEEYKEKVKANKDAILVKMADLRHNSDLRRLIGVTAKDVDRVVKYMNFYEELKLALI